MARLGGAAASRAGASAFAGGRWKSCFPICGDRVRRIAFWLQSQAIIRPAADEPFHVFDDRIDVLDVFLGRVGVVHAQVADAAELARDAEVQTNGFGVADVQIAVGLGRKTRVNLRIALLRDVCFDDVADEIRRARSLRRPVAIHLRRGPCMWGHHLS